MGFYSKLDRWIFELSQSWNNHLPPPSSRREWRKLAGNDGAWMHFKQLGEDAEDNARSIDHPRDLQVLFLYLLLESEKRFYEI